MSAVRFSIVVTAHNEEASIAACLEWLGSQEGLAPGETEIILVDDRSTDQTVRIAHATAIPGLRVLAAPSAQRPGLTARQAALDHGISAAAGAVVGLVDADATGPPDWAARMCAAVEHQRADLVAAPVSFRPAGRLLASLQSVDSIFYLGWCRMLSALGLDAGVLFANAAFRREAYQRLGGFQALGFSLTEDLLFARAVQRSGGRIAFQSTPVVSVRACPTWAALIERARRTSSPALSPLSVSLGAWMLSIPVFAAGAAAADGWWTAALLARMIVGPAALATGIWHTRQPRLLPYALAYDAAAWAAGIHSFIDRTTNRAIEWGGLRYERQR